MTTFKILTSSSCFSIIKVWKALHISQHSNFSFFSIFLRSIPMSPILTMSPTPSLGRSRVNPSPFLVLTEIQLLCFAYCSIFNGWLRILLLASERLVLKVVIREWNNKVALGLSGVKIEGLDSYLLIISWKTVNQAPNLSELHVLS